MRLTSTSPSRVPDLAFVGRSKDGLYEPALADSEREAVADLLGYLENVHLNMIFQFESLY